MSDLEKEQKEYGRMMANQEKEAVKKRGRPKKETPSFKTIEEDLKAAKTEIAKESGEQVPAPKEDSDKVTPSEIDELKAMVGQLAIKLEETQKKIQERPPASIRLDTSKKKTFQPPKVGDPGVVVEKIKFVRNDQPNQPMNVYVRNREIEWKGELRDGKEYTLPTAVIKHLNSRVIPKYEQRQDPENPNIYRSQVVGHRQRCMCISVS